MRQDDGTVGRTDDGSALVEFTWLALLLLLPLVYVLLSAFQVQRAAFGVTEAARQAGRAYATAPDLSTADARAREAAALALGDQGVDEPPRVEVTCDRPCLDPGAVVTVTVAAEVRLPALSLLGAAAPAIPVRAEHDEVVDAFRAPG